MKLFIFCLIGSLLCVTWAEVKNNEDKATLASDKSSASKPKRDAGLLSSAYHGPSYKYLPPSTVSSSTYDTYPGTVNAYAGFSGGHIPGIAGVYRTPSNSVHGHRHHGFSSPGYRNIPVYHSVQAEPSLSYSGGHHGYTHPSYSHYAGQGSTQFLRPGYKTVAVSNTGAKFGAGDFSLNRPHSFVFANANGIGTSSASDGGYHYSKGVGSSLSSVPSTGFQSVDGFNNSPGFNSHDEHHGDHVHNGAQEHVYVISNTPTALGNSYASKPQPSVHQHPLPSAAGGSYNTKYYTHTSPAAEQGPGYAAGHKGLGYFGFVANKPQVLHSSLSGSSFQQPAYSKAPFRPSTFLGAKFEGSGHNDAGSQQQYLPPLEEGSGTTGYNYPTPAETSVSYQDPQHQQTVEIQSATAAEPDSAYLPPTNNQDSLYEISSAPSGNYLPPTDSYGVPYSH